MGNLCGGRKKARGKELLLWCSANAELPGSKVKRGLGASPMFHVSQGLRQWQTASGFAPSGSQMENVNCCLGGIPGEGDFGIGQQDTSLVFKDPVPQPTQEMPCAQMCLIEPMVLWAECGWWAHHGCLWIDVRGGAESLLGGVGT